MTRHKERVKRIYFSDEYDTELEHFLQQDNKSKYIMDLIRRDLRGITSLDKDTYIKLQEAVLKLAEGAVFKSESIPEEGVSPDLAKDILGMFTTFSE